MPRTQPLPVDLHVGSCVRMRRLTIEMSQEKLADGLGITFQQVQKYEKGTNRISASRLQHIAQILEVPVTFFFDGAPGNSKAKYERPSPNLEIEFLATSEGKALSRAFQRLPSRKLRRSVVTLVEELAERR